MTEKSVVLIVSDLHMGGGLADPGEDHVYQGAPFRRFVEEQTATPEGAAGEIELFINGDFLEFAQVAPQVYTLGSPDFWCSEEESLQKLGHITSGHAETFASFRKFMEAGNRITIAAGNHDVDFYWPRVQEAFRQAAGDGVEFALEQEWVERFDGALRIAHGHQVDPANEFKNWKNPILDGPDGKRLEMCPGTLFMVKFVNWLEESYPFADNLKPVVALRHILMRESKFGLLAAGWVLTKFLANHPRAALGLDTQGVPKVGQKVIDQLDVDEGFAEDMARIYRVVRKDPAATADTVRAALKNERQVYDFLYEMMPCVPPEEWTPILNQIGGTTLAVGGKARTLAIAKGNGVDKNFLRNIAKKEFESHDAARVLVLGHTHQPDEAQFDGLRYYNPGSWTRYVEYDADHPLALEDLKRETDFPYDLNYVRVEKQTGGVDSRLVTFEQGKGAKF